MGNYGSKLCCVMMPEFDRQWKRLCLGDVELRYLQQELLENPKVGNIMKGTGGLRKYRIAFPGHGKSSSGRIAYVDFAVHEVIYLITAYPKSAKDNLSAAEQKEIAKMIETLRGNLKEKGE